MVRAFMVGVTHTHTHIRIRQSQVYPQYIFVVASACLVVGPFGLKSRNANKRNIKPARQQFTAPQAIDNEDNMPYILAGFGYDGGDNKFRAR
jgi:hypothetical protein